jgi:hypothetical protein
MDLVQAQNDGSSKIERNVPLVVDSFYSVFLLKIQSGFRNTRHQELVYEAKFIFDDRYCKSVYDFNGIKLFLATVDYLELPVGIRGIWKKSISFQLLNPY